MNFVTAIYKTNLSGNQDIFIKKSIGLYFVNKFHPQDSVSGLNPRGVFNFETLYLFQKKNIITLEGN